jgi:hypothetical protein
MIGTLRCTRCLVLSGEHDLAGNEFEIFDILGPAKYEMVCQHCLRPRDLDGIAKMTSAELAVKAAMYANRNAGRPDVKLPA